MPLASCLLEVALSRVLMAALQVVLQSLSWSKWWMMPSLGVAPYHIIDLHQCSSPLNSIAKCFQDWIWGSGKPGFGSLLLFFLFCDLGQVNLIAFSFLLNLLLLLWPPTPYNHSKPCPGFSLWWWSYFLTELKDVRKFYYIRIFWVSIKQKAIKSHEEL